MAKRVYISDDAGVYQFIDMFIRTITSQEPIFIHDMSFIDGTGLWCYERTPNGTMTLHTELSPISNDEIILMVTDNEYTSYINDAKMQPSVKLERIVTADTFESFIESHNEQLSELISIKCMQNVMLSGYVKKHRITNEQAAEFDAILRKCIIKYCSKKWLEWLLKCDKFNDFDQMLSFDKMVAMCNLIDSHGAFLNDVISFGDALFDYLFIPSILTIMEHKSSKS